MFLEILSYSPVQTTSDLQRQSKAISLILMEAQLRPVTRQSWELLKFMQMKIDFREPQPIEAKQQRVLLKNMNV